MNRRSFAAACVGVLAGAALRCAGQETAGPKGKLFTKGMLGGNRVAATFAPVPSDLAAPGTALLADDGRHTFQDLKGKVRLVTLWAEWCPACVISMPDLAQLQKRYGSATFEILAVLTSSNKKLSLADARDELIKLNADALPLWVEPDGGRTLLKSLASRDGKAALPCDLIVDTQGRIRGRSFGTTMAGFTVELTADDIRDGQLTDTGKAKVATAQAKISAQRSTWNSPDADAFVNALANGALG